jgi:hypothetical protein
VCAPAAAAAASAWGDVPQPQAPTHPCTALLRCAALPALLLCALRCPDGAPRPPPAPPAGTTSVSYTSQLTGGHFIFDSTPLDYPGAVAACAARGGWLASFSSFQEQAELEAFLVDDVRGPGPAPRPALPVCKLRPDVLPTGPAGPQALAAAVASCASSWRVRVQGLGHHLGRLPCR